MILKNALVMDNDFQLKRLNLRIEGGKIAEISEHLDQPGLDLSGMYILPGFIDTHIHGAYGVRVSDTKAELAQITRFEATQGVTGIAITTASSTREDLLKQIDTAVAASEKWSSGHEEEISDAGVKGTGAKIVAVHAEGPFLSRKFKGAMNPDNILAPNRDMLDEMLAHSHGLLKLLTVAPEEEGALEMISYAAGKGITVSMGHTNATYEDVMKAMKAGALRTTHTFNAMRPLNHREPGILGAALTQPEISCEMICDYVHLHPATVKLLYLTKGAERLMMVSDSGHAAGLSIPEFTVDGITRYVKDGVVRLADGTIAGSAKTLLDGVRNLWKDGIPLSDISRMASYNPARTLQMDHLTGSIQAGKLADLVVLDENLRVSCTFVNGACVYEACSRNA